MLCASIFSYMYLFVLIVLTCYVVHGIESNAETSNLQAIRLLIAAGRCLNPIPVGFLELGVVEGVEGWTLVRC